jgi:hypothetical protein
MCNKVLHRTINNSVHLKKSISPSKVRIRDIKAYKICRRILEIQTLGIKLSKAVHHDIITKDALDIPPIFAIHSNKERKVIAIFYAQLAGSLRRYIYPEGTSDMLALLVRRLPYMPVSSSTRINHKSVSEKCILRYPFPENALSKRGTTDISETHE